MEAKIKKAMILGLTTGAIVVLWIGGWGKPSI